MADALLLDLDGTLADTAPDLAHATNLLRRDMGLPPIPDDQLRAHTSSGARGMLHAAFGLTPACDDYAEMVERFLAHYAENICLGTRIFDGMTELLDDLDRACVPWGIVTNKHSRYTTPLVAALGLAHRACCVISGDSAARPKPAADPLFLACERSGLDPRRCIYAGDDLRDVVAGREAGMVTVAVRWGYLGDALPIDEWGADAVISHPGELRGMLGP